MTEREKAEAGLLYDANYNSELVEERARCHDLCRQYNTLNETEAFDRMLFLENLFGQIGKGFEVIAPFWCDYGRNIFAGDHLFLNFNTVILDEARVKFGDNVFVAPNCGFYTAGHPLDAARRNQGLEYARPITIGDNVWIGANTTVLPGVTIGSNTVIGAGSVVTHDIPDGVVATGAPCRVRRAITAEDEQAFSV